jgi:acetyl-CoA carboxylase carboxyltransferase component
MSWQDTLDELEHRKAIARQMGGPEKVKRQHDFGKLTVRERIDRLLDAGSFREIGSACGTGRYDAQGRLTEFTPANNVIGRGSIEGRPVAVYGDDFTVRGGASDGSVKEKHNHTEKMAAGLRIPLIRLIEGNGGGGSVKSIEKQGYANLPGSFASSYYTALRMLNTVPVVTMALGSVAGRGAARLCASHYSLMVKDQSQIFIGGPALVAKLGQTQGKTYTKEELGGATIHARNGTVDDVVASEAEAFERTRRFLSYLPRSAHELPPRHSTGDDPARREEKLLSIIPKDSRKVYSMRAIMEAVTDQGSFFEIGKLWGRSIITGLARLDGWPVAILGGDPYHYAGSWTRASCEKLIRFVNLAQTFHLPVVHLVDCPGFPIGLDAEKESTIRVAMRAMSAINLSTVPWCSILIRNVFGVAGSGHRPTAGYTTRYGWPSLKSGSLPFEGGIEVGYKADIEAAADPEAKMQEIRERLERLRSPLRTAESFALEEMIDPRDTRSYLCDFANVAQACLEPGEARNFYHP